MTGMCRHISGAVQPRQQPPHPVPQGHGGMVGWRAAPGIVAITVPAAS